MGSERCSSHLSLTSPLPLVYLGSISLGPFGSDHKRSDRSRSNMFSNLGAILLGGPKMNRKFADSGSQNGANMVPEMILKKDPENGRRSIDETHTNKTRRDMLHLLARWCSVCSGTLNNDPKITGKIEQTLNTCCKKAMSIRIPKSDPKRAPKWRRPRGLSNNPGQL